MQVTSQRASAILYNYLSGNHFDKPFLLPANVCPVVPPVVYESRCRF